MSFEEAIQRSMTGSNPEKTFIDKILAREDVNAIRELVRKPRLTRSDLLDILYLLSSVESKLLNYNEWDRYIILKFFVWVREVVQFAEMMYDYTEDLKKEEILSKEVADATNEQLLSNIQRLLEHCIKFLVDLYLNIGRTTLSVGATGLLEILKNKYEMAYSGSVQQLVAAPQQQKGWGLFKR